VDEKIFSTVVAEVDLSFDPSNFADWGSWDFLGMFDWNIDELGLEEL